MYAAAQFKLSRKVDGGKTYRETLEHVAPHTASAQLELEELEKPSLPFLAVGAWGAFLEMSGHRASSGFGPSALSWLDLDAWQRVTGCTLEAFERDLVFELDRLFLQDLAAEASKRQRAKS